LLKPPGRDAGARPRRGEVQVVKPVSPYLLRPLRTLAEALRELGQGAREPASDQPLPTASAGPDESSAQATNPRDSITIGGVEMPVEPGEPTQPTTGGQIDIKA
jgi:hypothetical protein